MNNRERVALHQEWWQRKNSRPLVDNFSPVTMPYGGLDIDVPVAHIGERKRANAAALAAIAQDLLVVQRVDYGTAFVAALAGAGFHHDGQASWNTPVAANCRDMEVRGFDPEHPLWVAYAQRRDEMLRHWSWETFLPGHLNNIGPFDVLAALMGAENLLLEMMDDPEGVSALSLQAAALIADVMREEVRSLRERGPTEGTTDGFRVWLPGAGTRFVEDFSALLSPALTRQFVLPASRRATQGFDSVLYHTHSAAWRNLPAMAEVGGRLAIEFGTDPGENPDLGQRIAAVRDLQNAGLPVQYGSWNYPLTAAEVERVVAGLDHRGLILRFQVHSAEASDALYRQIKDRHGG